MAYSANHRCKVCDVAYYNCDLCDITKEMQWKTVCCSLPHYLIFSAVAKYKRGALTKKKAAALVKDANITQEEMNTFRPDIKAALVEIMYEKPSATVEEDAEIVSAKTTKSTSKSRKPKK